jgi:hypothetical protein
MGIRHQRPAQSLAPAVRVCGNGIDVGHPLILAADIEPVQRGHHPAVHHGAAAPGGGKGGVKKDINDLGEESKKLSEKVTKNVGDALTSLATFYDTYGKAIEDATGKTWGLVDAIKALMDAEKNKKEEDNNKKDEKPKEEPKDNGQNTPELKVGSSVDVKSGTK